MVKGSKTSVYEAPVLEKDDTPSSKKVTFKNSSHIHQNVITGKIGVLVSLNG